MLTCCHSVDFKDFMQIFSSHFNVTHSPEGCVEVHRSMFEARDRSGDFHQKYYGYSSLAM